LTVLLEFENFCGFINIKDINDQPTPFHILNYTFSKCLNAELTLQGNSGEEDAFSLYKYKPYT